MVDTEKTLQSVVKYWAEKEPDKEVFVFVNTQRRLSAWTPKDLYVLGGRFASRLKEWGFTKGDVIANNLPNSPERLITDIGINMAGCIVLNCQILEKDGSDFWNMVSVSKCSGIVFKSDTPTQAFKLMNEYMINAERSTRDGGNSFSTLSIPEAPELTKAVMVGRGTSGKDNETIGNDVKEGSFLESLIQSSEPVFFEDSAPTDTAYIFTTSGTTGYSKLVARTHHNLLRTVPVGLNTPSLKTFSDRPFGWAGGFPYKFYLHCDERVLQDAFDGKQGLSGKEVWSAIHVENCEAAMVLPEGIIDILDHLQGAPVEKQLDMLLTGGQPLKLRHGAAVGYLCKVLLLLYASTEAMVMVRNPVTNQEQVKDYLSGRPRPQVSIKVVNKQLEDVPTGTEGSIVVKSPAVISHYYNYTPKEPIFTPDGYFMTGDRGKLDKDGNLYVYCRDGDVITQDAILVYLNWPEAVIGKCPGVSDVVAVGVKVSEDEDKICACVVPKKDSGLTEADVKAFYDDHFVHDFASDEEYVPKLDYVMMYSSFPLTENGKLNKKKLKTDAQAKFGQSS